MIAGIQCQRRIRSRHQRDSHASGLLTMPYDRSDKQRCKPRRLSIQRLEDRFALTAEGETFALNRTFDTYALGGDLSAQVRWGDGTTSNATVQGGIGPEKIKVKIDYSLDTSNFFSTSRRQLLQSVVDTIAGKLNDTLTAIIPGGSNSWSATLIHPSTGQTITRDNLRINANELLVFAGARPMPGEQLGEGGFGGYSGFGSTDFITAITTRGQGTVTGPGANDFGPWGGFISFDTTEDWYFGTDGDAVPSTQADFVTTAAHEFLHLLGFGIAPSWTRLVSGTTFTGANAKAEYDGTGNVPLLSDKVHWQLDLADNGSETLMDPNQVDGQRKVLTRLDSAALKDIGWEFVVPTARVLANHVYPDNGAYIQEVTIVGSKGGEVASNTNVTITNVRPTVSVVGTQTVVAGNNLSLQNIAEISDPGFRNLQATPATAETFSYSILWGDGSAPSTGPATIDRIGSAGVPTLASLDASHVYANPGNYTAQVTVTDDDGGTTSKSFTVNVLPPTTLSITTDQSRMVEDGSVQANLTVRRSGGNLANALQVSLVSSDTSEATIVSSFTFEPNQSTITLPLQAVDDTLLDGDQSVTITATATGAIPGSLQLTVADYETIHAAFTPTAINESDGENAVRLSVTRSNTDVGAPLALNLSGITPETLSPVTSWVIPAGSQTVSLWFDAVDDTIAELTEQIQVSVTADGYQRPGTASLEIFDNEAPKFQNAVWRYDVNDDTFLTPLDALIIINFLNRKGGSQSLDPADDSVPHFYDVTGDYSVTPLDALQVINALSRGESPPTGEGEGEPITGAPVPDAWATHVDDWFKRTFR